MPTNIFGDGLGHSGLTYSDVTRSVVEAQDEFLTEVEELVIKHIELATDKKHIVVNGEDKYIPLDEAKKLGLL